MRLSDVPKLQKFMMRAKQVSEFSDYSKYMIGAVIVSNGKIISRGWSQEKTHPFIEINGSYQTPKGLHISKNIHAECAAIFKVKNKEILMGATIYVFRENKQGEIVNSRPCPMCEKVLRKYGFKKMVYTINGGIQEEYL